MKFHTITDLGFNGGASLPDGNFVAVGIAPSSALDTCMIGPHMLGPQAIVPFNTQVTAIRGYPIETNIGDEYDSTLLRPRSIDQLVLVLYERGDVLVPPGPRAPFFESSTLVSGGGSSRSTFGTTVATAGCAFRVPFFGRKQAKIAIRRFDSAGGFVGGVTLVVRGLTYLTKAQISACIYHQPNPIGNVNSIYEDAASVAIPGDPATISAITSGGNRRLGEIVYVGGGGDNQEGFDELEGWIYGAADPDSMVTCQVEVTGERGR